VPTRVFSGGESGRREASKVEGRRHREDPILLVAESERERLQWLLDWLGVYRRGRIGRKVDETVAKGTM
jgi:hypothetical protein